MRYRKITLYKIIIGLFVVLQNFTLAAAADFESTIELESNNNVVRIAGRHTTDSRVANKRNLGFLPSAGGISGLGMRVSELRLFGPSGKAVIFRKLMNGEYLADSDYAAWEYSVDLSPHSSSNAAGHVSWLTNTNGILMLDDLLPQFTVGKEKVSASISLQNRAEWTAAGGADLLGVEPTTFDDYRKGIIYLGTELRHHRPGVGSKSVSFTFSGDWHFTDKEAIVMTEEVMAKLANTFGSIPEGAIRIGIFKFPMQVNPGSWEAETRGNNVSIISSDMPFRTQSTQRLHEQLRHELFHLWIPNGLSLTGNYAWFYEGLALYHSLKMAVELKRIGFDDMLDTLSRAYQIDLRQKPRRPLIDPSGLSVGVADTATYARGILVAFLLDVEFLRSSKERSGVISLFSKIFSANPSNTDGNTYVLNAIGQSSIVSKYVKGAEIIDPLMIEITTGFTFDGENGFKIVEKPNSRQREILSKLSYNTWRSSNRIKK